MKRIFDVLLDLVYPKSLYCICCGNIIDASRSYSICDHCMDRIRWNVDEPKPMDGFSLLKCCEYGIYERSIIFSLKYNGNRYIADHVADICADRLRAAGIKGDAVIPVPLYRSKELKRGFNQSALIAEALAGKTGMSAELRMLVRTRDTMPMRSLGPAERRRNIAGSISLSHGFEGSLAGRTLIVVDDFYTTGSTACECVEALRPTKASEIYFLAFAAR